MATRTVIFLRIMVTSCLVLFSVVNQFQNPVGNFTCVNWKGIILKFLSFGFSFVNVWSLCLVHMFGRCVWFICLVIVFDCLIHIFGHCVWSIYLVQLCSSLDILVWSLPILAIYIFLNYFHVFFRYSAMIL